MKMMIIYETRNLINGKVYRGQHICGVDCQTGCKYLGSGTALKRAIKKYGRHNFRRRILAYATYPSVLNDLEKIYVTDDFVARQDTYNQMTGGGSSGSPSAETRAKNSAALKGHEVSTETRKKISAATSASMTPARRKKISASAIARYAVPGQREKTGAATSAAMKDKPKSEAHKAATSAAMELVWAKKRQAEQAEQEKYQSKLF